MDELKRQLAEMLECDVLDLHMSSVGGGNINAAYRVEYGGIKRFVKVNDAQTLPEMFEKERLGLELLAKSEFRIPEVVDVIYGDQQSALVLEWIEQGRPADDFWEQFGRKLAHMHLLTNDCFGLDHANYIGSLPQSNTLDENWITFFTESRINPQMKRAIAQGLLDQRDMVRFMDVKSKLEDYFPEEPPALLHGDLWSGNFLCDDKGNAVLIDPAVYYGHRLMDIGMTMLFGGFDPRMYDAYHEVFPLPANWRTACKIANLYPLLVHVNLFGRSYASQVRQILNESFS